MQIQDEREKLVLIIEDARTTISELQQELNEAQSTISDVTGHIGSKMKSFGSTRYELSNMRTIGSVKGAC